MWRNSKARMRGASVGSCVSLGDAVLAGNMRGLSIGDESSLGACDVMLHASVTIGARVVVNDGARLLTASHALRDSRWSTVSAAIVIEDYAWIATGAIILGGVTIGRGAVVGAGAVVRHDVPAYSLAIGNPAVVIPDARASELDYSPVLMTAPFEAWVGHRVTNGCAR